MARFFRNRTADGAKLPGVGISPEAAPRNERCKRQNAQNQESLKLSGRECRLMMVWEMGDKNFVVLHHWGRIDQFPCHGPLHIGSSQRLQKRYIFPDGQEQEFGTIPVYSWLH